MAILVNAHQIQKQFSEKLLFQNLNFSVETGERIGLIGPNGSGKSTLLKIIAGIEKIDGGIFAPQRGLKLAYLAQNPDFNPKATIYESILEGADDPYDWEAQVKAEEWMAVMNLNNPNSSIQGTSLIESLSGGTKKRVAIARELMRNPDLFLLDEPTNHLDIESVLWLEDLLANSSFASICITHDRAFLQKISNRIIEINKKYKDGMISIKADYAEFLERREEILLAQQIHETKMRNTLRRETEWLRRGAKARQTKQQARINQAHNLKQAVESLSQRNQSFIAQMQFQSLEKNPKKLIEAIGISKSFSNKSVVPEIDLLITPKTRMALIGKNGCGKSTLIKMLLKKLEPDSGTVQLADNLQVAYFEQNRDDLNQNTTVIKSLSPDSEYVDFGGKSVFAKTYLNRFLFRFDQMDMPVYKLSGGEQSRLLLAKLMLTKANLLILDEPTNDLDMETLDVLQDVIEEFPGAVILVSHDRYFLNAVCTSFYAFGINLSNEREITALSSMDQWEEWHDQQLAIQDYIQEQYNNPSDAVVEKVVVEQKVKVEQKKLSSKERTELEKLEKNIQVWEKQISDLQEQSLKSENISNHAKILELSSQMAELQTQLDQAFLRWTELSERA